VSVVAPVSTSREWSLRAALSRGQAVTAGAFLAVSALAMLIVSPRFTIGGLSLVDDWSGYERSPHALRQLLRLSYDPAAFGDPNRYRPGSVGVWNSLEWHTLGAPASLVGPNVWNTLRILLFVVSAMALLLATVPRTLRPRARLALAAGLPVLVLTTPGFAVDLARFGPVEPLLVGGMTGGALLLVLAIGKWLAWEPWWRVMPLLGAGWVLWVFGVYQKETSVCFLVAAPFLYLFLDRRWRATGVIRRPLWTHRRFSAVAVAALVPVVHMATEVWRVAAAGTTAYHQQVPHGAGGILGRLVVGTAKQWAAMSLAVESPVWAILSLTGVVVAVRVLRRREPLDWLVVGFVATGWSALAFQALSGADIVSRYYLPSATLFGAAVGLAVARSRPSVRRADLVVAGLVVLLGGFGSYWSVTGWAANEREGNVLVHQVAALNPQRCPVYFGRMEMEAAKATAVLAPLEGRGGTTCATGGDAVLVAGRSSTPASYMDDRIFAACQAPGWRTLARTRHYEVLACSRLADGSIRGKPVESVLAHDRLVPSRAGLGSTRRR
jgi:hypothetical protein